MEKVYSLDVFEASGTKEEVKRLICAAIDEPDFDTIKVKAVINAIAAIPQEKENHPADQ